MLYGVTMQEQGVSRMLMLNLAEAERKSRGRSPETINLPDKEQKHGIF